MSSPTETLSQEAKAVQEEARELKTDGAAARESHSAV
jgi:hypothetical protein